MTDSPQPALPLVLVVDDYEDARDMMVLLLETHLFRTTSAASVAGALATLSAEPPAVIVTDIGMPIVDGWAFIQQLKSDGHTRDIPVMVVTATSDLATKTRALALGSTFFPKPFAPNEFIAEVRYLAYRVAARDRRSHERSHDVGEPGAVTGYHRQPAQRRAF